MRNFRLSSSGGSGGGASSIADRINRLSVGSSEEKTARFVPFFSCLFSLSPTLLTCNTPVYQRTAPLHQPKWRHFMARTISQSCRELDKKQVWKSASHTSLPLSLGTFVFASQSLFLLNSSLSFLIFTSSFVWVKVLIIEFAFVHYCDDYTPAI